MVITPQLREALNQLGATKREFEWLRKPAQRKGGAIVLELPTEQHSAAIDQLQQLDNYECSKISSVKSKDRLGVQVMVSVPFVRGVYKTNDCEYECRALTIVPSFNLPVVVWQSRFKPEMGVMAYDDWAEMVMRGKLKFVSAY